jgi:regulatory protein YycI of two-component signal transduction system YycFG
MRLFKNGKTHMERGEDVRAFARKNKVFVIMMILAVIFLSVNFFFREASQKHEEYFAENDAEIAE